MADVRAARHFARIDRLEMRLCLQLNRLGRHGPTRALFRVVSRLGNGLFWYVLLALLPIVHGYAGLRMSLAMVFTGIAGVILYKGLKRRLVRERPYIRNNGIHCGTPPLDRYSFPSGHTLHAVAFTAMLFPWYPTIAMAVMPFTLLVALSRVVLGLHYPTDVLAGAGLGLALASLGSLGLSLL